MNDRILGAKQLVLTIMGASIVSGIFNNIDLPPRSLTQSGSIICEVVTGSHSTMGSASQKAHVVT